MPNWGEGKKTNDNFSIYGVGFFDCEDAYTEDKKKKREIFHHCMKMNGDCEKCKYRRPSIEEFVCTHIQIGACGVGGQKILIVGEKNENYTGENIYLTREAAEARLAELEDKIESGELISTVMK